MARDDWFRNNDWNADVESGFFSKLKRTRNKAQYLRIQACILASRHPRVALRLLDEYFALGENFDEAQAHVDRAHAHLSLGEVDNAIAAYESALAVEEQRPNLRTNAYILLPFVISLHHVNPRYDQAEQLLHKHKDRLTFPVDHFMWHAAQALIGADLRKSAEAKIHAHLALEQSAKDHSGFRHHADVGLVGNDYESLRRQLAKIRGGSDGC